MPVLPVCSNNVSSHIMVRCPYIPCHHWLWFQIINQKKKIFFFFSFLPSNFPPHSLLSFLPTVMYAALKSHLPVHATLWFLSITSRNNANWMGDQSFLGVALDFLNKSGGKISRKKLQLLWVCKGKRSG